MNEIEIKQKLDQLAEFQSERDIAMLEKQSLLNEIYTAEIKARMAEIEAEFADKTEAVSENIAALKSEIETAVKAHGKTVKSTLFQAVWSKARYSYSDEPKDDYISATVYRKLGEPSVSIKSVAK
jgi:predicted transcriptional regulator